MRTLLLGFGATVALAHAASGAETAVTAEDNAAIQALVAGYAKALGGCDAEGFAGLFATDGVFASGFRGHVVGHDRLVALVESERHCIAPSPNGPQARPGGNTPTSVVSTDASGVIGTVKLGDIAQYEDRYVKTKDGWRIASRTVLTAAEMAAGLNGKQMDAIQALSRDVQPADHYDVDKDTGKKRFLSSGVVILVKDGVVGGRVYRDDGSHYEDVYEQTAPGQWRIKSRTLVPAAKG